MCPAPNDLGQRLQALTLAEYGVKRKDVALISGISESSISKLCQKARTRGYDPAVSKQLLLEYVDDGKRAGRPLLGGEDGGKAAIEKLISRDRYGREKTLDRLALDMNMSANTVRNRLKEMGYHSCKPTTKPGLTETMRKARLEWCLAHRDWGLEGFKNVIWTDETSVVIGQRRGAVRVWRRKDEKFVKTCVRNRWKGCSEFMFWGSFSYDEKGPCHIWRPETAKEKRDADLDLQRRNAEAEPALQTEWELNTFFPRLGLRGIPGRKPQWKFTAATGKLVRREGKGIDWYRHQQKIVKEKIIPFAKRCQLSLPNTIVMEDGAPCHIHRDQARVYKDANIPILSWCGNSPDLNPIEAAWPYLKRHTTRKGPAKSKLQGVKRWTEQWDAIPQNQIRRWISRIPLHIERIIAEEGGNEYAEGHNCLATRITRNAETRERRKNLLLERRARHQT
jgi:hypothetical protein